jgi:hypothetical protein
MVRALKLPRHQASLAGLPNAPRPKKVAVPTKCGICRHLYRSVESAMAHERKAHGVHWCRGRRIRKAGDGMWKVERLRHRFASLSAARDAVAGGSGGSVHAFSGGLPTLGKRG